MYATPNLRLRGMTLTTTNNRYGQEAWRINMSHYNHYAVNRDDGKYLHNQRCNIRSLLMTILDRSIETLGRECNLIGILIT